MYSYDDLYGVSLEEYCKIHNTTIDKLIEKKEKDIKLLRENLQRLVRQKDETFKKTSDLQIAIQELISKKEEHLKYLKKQKRGIDVKKSESGFSICFTFEFGVERD